MDGLLEYINVVKNTNFSNIWLGETSSFFGGGAPNLSDTFAAGFLWIDKLGLSALHGMDVVARQELHGCWKHNRPSSYSLLDYEDNMRPNPDYYLSVLYKKLVGHVVYNATTQPSNNYLRLYASSSLRTDGFVIYGSKLDNTSFTIDVPSLANKQVTVYVLNSNDTGNLRSKTSTLNGNALNWISHEPGPNLEGSITTLPSEIPGYSQFFIVVNQSTGQCLSGWHPLSSVKNKCIKVINETQALFAARFDCSTYGYNTTMLSIDSAFENSEITKQASTGGCNQYYIGLVRSANNWVWANNDSSTYRNWANGFPTSDNTKNCVVFDGKTGTWLNTDCDGLQCYVCQQYF